MTAKDRPNGAKQRIINAAINLFSDQSYDKVTTRDIAKAVDMKAASLYNYFSSKGDILTQIYALYEETMDGAKPDMNELLILAATAHPHDVLMKTNFHVEPSLQETMDRIVIIASAESRMDARSEQVLRRNIFDMPKRLMGPLLTRMLELGRIEPMDIDSFLLLLTNFCYSAALRNYTGYPVSMREWYRGVTLLYQLVKPTDRVDGRSRAWPAENP
jgi:AcrR family transcriptional regulator